jgi:hypothetical protein
MATTTITTNIIISPTDPTKVRVTTTETTVNGESVNSTRTKDYDKNTYLSNQYQIKANALTVKANAIAEQDAIIAAAEANINAVNAL